MKVALHQVDGHFPNLALMQVAKYHEERGDTVEAYPGGLFAGQYDKIYHSKVFSFSPMPYLHEQSVIGGTGIDFKNRLPAEIESCGYSYSLYPDCDFHIGQTQRGCRFACLWCCVPQKEGKNRPHSPLEDILINPNGGRKVLLIDNDFFGSKAWKQVLHEIIERDLLVCFNQGLNIRLITTEQATLLSKVKFRNTNFNDKYLTFAWDRFSDREKILAGIERCVAAGIPTRLMQFLCLVGFDSTPEQDMQRIMELRNLGAMPFVMPYNRKDEYQKRFARWVNNRAVFKSVTWEEYKHTSDEGRPSRAKEFA